MKKRILSMLLILCLVIGIISTAAFAAEAAGLTVEIYISGHLSGTFDETNRYYHNENHLINSDPTGANAVMDFYTNTLTLNNLDLTGRIKVSGGDITVVLNGTNKINYIPSSIYDPNWLIFCDDIALAIKGPGSLELSSEDGGSSAIHASGEITISDGAKIDGTITGTAQVISGGNVIITGEGTSVKATATGSGRGINVGNGDGTTLTVTDGATLEAESARAALMEVATLSAAGSTVTVGESAPGSAWDGITDINTYKYVKIAPDTPTPDANGAFAAGGNTYATAEDAFAVANTVTLVKDYSESFTIPAGKSFDGGAYTVSGTVTNNGTITGGTYADSVLNEGGTISGGTFNGAVSNTLNTSNVSYITGGTFKGQVTNGKSNGSVNSVISGGTFSYTNGNSFVNNFGTITNGTFNVNLYNYKTISSGTFNDTVTLYDGSTISGGTFNESVSADGSASITGGTFKAYENSNKEDADIVYGTGILDFRGVTDVDNFSVTIMGAYGTDGVPISDTNTGAAKIILLASGMAAYRNNNEVTYITESYSVFTKIQKKIASTTYTVTYDANGATSGSAPTDSNSPYNSGATVTVLGRPDGLDKDGYTFHCWNTAADGTGTDYVAGQTFAITANTTLYAKWEQVVNYDLWVGGVQVTSSNASNITGAGITGSVSYDNSTKTLTLNNANITGAYEHWNAMSAIYGETDLTIDLIGNNTITGTENSASSYGIYIDDKWNTDNTGKLTFTGSGSLTVSAADAPSYWSVAVFANDTITVGDSCSITAYCGDDASTIRAFYSYASSNKYVLPNVPGILIAGNKNAPEAANFEVCDGNPNAFQYLRIAHGYTVTLNKNGGTVNSGNVTCYFVDTGATLPTDVTKSGCEFVGWYDNAELTGEAVTAISATVTGNKEYWAKWEQNAVSPAATPTIGTDLSSTEVTYDKDAAATALSITASVTDGGTLTYQWYKNDAASTDGAQAIDDATSTTYTPATSATGTTYYYCVITNTKAGQTATATSAIAKITVREPAPTTYTVTYDANGGNGTVVDDAEYESGDAVTLKSGSVLTKDGYSFAGWNTEANGSGTPYSAGDTYTIAADTTFYAQWAQNEGEKDAAVDNTAAGSYAGTTVSGWGDLATKDDEGNAYPNNVTVEVKLTVTAKTENTAPPAEVTAIKNVASGKTLQFLDLTLSKTVNGTPISGFGSSNSQVLEIKIPFTVGNKQNITVYRYHGSGASAFDPLNTRPASAWEDGKFYVDSANNAIYIYAKQFSTYAIGYTVPAPTPTPNPPIYVPTVHYCTSKCDICGGCEDAKCTYSACKDKCLLLGMNFTDVADGKWYTEAVEYVYHHKMMEGVGNNIFDINGTTTRAMIVTILWRLEGEPVVNYLMQFEDVPADTWYTEAVRWAASEKIVEGWNGKFDPMGEITREQFATILWRYAKYKGYDVSVGEDTNILSYEDAFSVSEYAIPAMQWACGAGLMQGDGVNLTPKAYATRAQAAALFQRFCENVAEK